MMPKVEGPLPLKFAHLWSNLVFMLYMCTRLHLNSIHHNLQNMIILSYKAQKLYVMYLVKLITKLFIPGNLKQFQFQIHITSKLLFLIQLALLTNFFSFLLFITNHSKCSVTIQLIPQLNKSSIQSSSNQLINFHIKQVS